MVYCVPPDSVEYCPVTMAATLWPVISRPAPRQHTVCVCLWPFNSATATLRRSPVRFVWPHVPIFVHHTISKASMPRSIELSPRRRCLCRAAPRSTEENKFLIYLPYMETWSFRIRRTVYFSFFFLIFMGFFSLVFRFI